MIDEMATGPKSNDNQSRWSKTSPEERYLYQIQSGFKKHVWIGSTEG